VQLLGVEDVQAALARMLESTDDLTPVWDDIYHPASMEGMKSFYATEGDGKWPDLTSRYLFYKASHGGGTRTLIGTPNRRKFPRVTGTLMRSLTDKGHPAHIYTSNTRWMRTGTRDPLANIHFAKKGRRKRKAIDAKSLSMQIAVNKAVREHLARYEAQWEGRAA
jgi:hypothetical protein